MNDFSDDLIASAHRRARARRLADRTADRQRAALQLRLARASTPHRRATHAAHFLVGPLSAFRDTAGGAARCAELSSPSRAVPRATDRLLDVCAAACRLWSVDKPPATTARAALMRWLDPAPRRWNALPPGSGARATTPSLAIAGRGVGKSDGALLTWRSSATPPTPSSPRVGHVRLAHQLDLGKGE
jgi:hypothetical protein